MTSETWRAFRVFDPGGRVEVLVTRTAGSLGAPGPVIVTSLDAMPAGRAYRYRSHVDPVEVADIAQAWLESLPDDYCVRPECDDMRGYWWRELERMLARAECIGPQPTTEARWSRTIRQADRLPETNHPLPYREVRP